MFEPDLTYENAAKFSRFDQENLLSTCSPHPIILEQQQWPTVEHYFQAQIVADPKLAQQIVAAETPHWAYKIGSAWYRRKRKGWKALRRTVMTRGLYTKCMMYPEVRQALLDIDPEQKIIETSAYDHYWGIGRDQRGQNTLGKVWMDIRKKLREEG